MRSFIGAVLLLAASAGMAAETAHRLFTGTFENPDQLTQVIRAGDAMTRSTETIIPCTPGTQFGAAYLLEIPIDLQRESREHIFSETWTYPESDGQMATVASRQITGHFKRTRSNPLFSASVVGEGVTEDAEFHLSVSRQNTVYLEHSFRVMGCSDGTLDDLNQALAAADPDKLICTMEKQMGSRIRKRVCRTEAEAELHRDMMEMEIRGR